MAWPRAPVDGSVLSIGCVSYDLIEALFVNIPTAQSSVVAGCQNADIHTNCRFNLLQIGYGYGY